ncbi:MAG: DNA replication and repair protein RecF [Firmicutes bacterium ADurb.Bin419]|nr:MAG: DNA replication and repair protein RecF [Firmicutes bacterium ADurb.Bin419]
MENLGYDELMEIIMDLSTKAAREQTDELIQKVSDRMNKVQLLLKEKEMVLKELSEDSDELEQLEENIRELELKKGKLEDTGFSLRTALEVLEEANAEIKRDFAPLLNSNTSKIISEITSSRYGELRVDENLIPRTTEPVTGDIVPVSMLSGGTVDQMYLALRIALVQTIEKKSEKLPLIMDEVLAQYDDTRSLETLRMLKELSKDRQIILFTCKTKELELAKYVCNSKINIIELL